MIRWQWKVRLPHLIFKSENRSESKKLAVLAARPDFLVALELRNDISE